MREFLLTPSSPELSTHSCGGQLFHLPPTPHPQDPRRELQRLPFQDPTTGGFSLSGQEPALLVECGRLAQHSLGGGHGSHHWEQAQETSTRRTQENTPDLSLWPHGRCRGTGSSPGAMVSCLPAPLQDDIAWQWGNPTDKTQPHVRRKSERLRSRESPVLYTNHSFLSLFCSALI